MITRVIVAFVLSTFLAIRGYYYKNLSLSGAFAAFFIGFLTLSTSYRFGFILIYFYMSSSKFTKYYKEYKMTIADEKNGERNVTQVLASSFLATGVAVCYYIYVGEDSHIVINPSNTEDVIKINVFGGELSITRHYLAAMLWYAYLGHYSCATGDTWASELGVLARNPPRLITTFFVTEVPPGTNGGMSLLGTMASAVGGASTGLVFYCMSFLIPGSPVVSQLPMVILGLLCGFVGSFLDSLLGGLFQASYFCRETKRCVRTKRGDSILVCGRDWLSNETVNFLSIFFTMIFAGWIGPGLHDSLSLLL